MLFYDKIFQIRSFVCFLIFSLLITVSAGAAPPDPQQDIHFQVIKDTAAGLTITYVRDSLGNIYQLMPAGPKLPWGVSSKTIAAQGEKYGYKMIPATWAQGAVEAQRASPSVKERVAKAIKADKVAMGLTTLWEIKKIGNVIYVAYTGEGKASEAQYKIIGATASAELGLGAAYITGQIGAGMAGGFGVGVLATWAGNNVQQAIEEGLSAWEAKVEAGQAVKNWKKNDVRLATELLRKIRKAITEGDYNLARKLNKGLNAFTQKRQDSGGRVLSDLNALTFDLQDKIIKAQKAKKEAVAQAKARDQQEYLTRIRNFRREIKKKREKEAREKAEFDVRLLIVTPNIKPGEQGAAGLIIKGGKPPYLADGDFYGNLKKPQTLKFAFDTPKEPGAYGLSVRVMDSAGRVRYADGAIWIGDLSKKKKSAATAGKSYPFMIQNGPVEVRLNLSGFKITSVFPKDAGQGGVHHGDELTVRGILTEDRFSARGSCRGDISSDRPYGGCSVLVDEDDNTGTPPIYWVRFDQKNAGSFNKTFNRSFPVSRIVGNSMTFHILCKSGNKYIDVDFHLKKK